MCRHSVALGLPPLRKYWQMCNRQEREQAAQIREKRKASDKKRKKCRCDAYKFPHRPGGGLCLWPNPPAATWKEREAAEVEKRVQDFLSNFGTPNTLTIDQLRALMAKQSRSYRKRYAGLRRQIARANGLHPIKDRDKIELLLPWAISIAKRLHAKHPRSRYRTAEITEHGVRMYVG